MKPSSAQRRKVIKEEMAPAVAPPSIEQVREFVVGAVAQKFGLDQAAAVSLLGKIAPPAQPPPQPAVLRRADLYKGDQPGKPPTATPKQANVEPGLKDQRQFPDPEFTSSTTYKSSSSSLDSADDGLTVGLG